jgi:hypothetical protein
MREAIQASPSSSTTRLMFVLTVTKRGKVGSDRRRHLRVDREIPARRSNSLWLMSLMGISEHLGV